MKVSEAFSKGERELYREVGHIKREFAIEE